MTLPPLPPSRTPSALICDIDGTITDERRRINTDAIAAIRTLVDAGVPVVLASGNTICSMDILCKMIGTDGTIIAENGGVYRVSFQGVPRICGDQKLCWEAFHILESHFAEQGRTLDLYSPDYRVADVAFARTVDIAEVRAVLRAFPVRILDTSFAIHLQSPGVNKGSAFLHLAAEMGIEPADFVAVGDSENDAEMLGSAGMSAAVANGHQVTKDAADIVTEKLYGDGFVEAVRFFFSAYFLER
ncbi:MAG: phosphoglycolate phosphatase [Methanomicrobiales archaeon]|nr:phosphoglycolate phosphatase [Methanomicrobiales archaeon]